MTEILVKSNDVEGAVQICEECGRFVEVGSPVWAYSAKSDQPICPDCLREHDPAVARVLAEVKGLKGGCLHPFLETEGVPGSRQVFYLFDRQIQNLASYKNLLADYFILCESIDKAEPALIKQLGSILYELEAIEEKLNGIFENNSISHERERAIQAMRNDGLVA